MIRRLRLKFICANMAIVTVMLTAIFGAMYQVNRATLEQEIVDQMRMMVAVDTVLSQDGRQAAPPSWVWDNCFILQLNQNGSVIGVTQQGTDAPPDWSVLEDLAEIALSDGRESAILEEYSLRYCRVSAPMGEYLVFVDSSYEQSRLQDSLMDCLLLGAASFAAFLIISILLARWAVKPVEQAWKEQRQFVADASHELKTPLTVILTNAELLQDPGYDPAAKQTFSQHILLMSRQMRELIEQLLELARVDNGLPNAVRQRVDWSKAVADAVMIFEPVYFEQGHSASTWIEPGLEVMGDPVRLQQVAEILLDNAGKYANPHSVIEVDLRRISSKQCLLSVSDPGAPLSREDLNNIFKRFYRTDPARERNGSYGLGLAIAEGIVTGCRGRIWAESENGINTFYVRLPLLRQGREKKALPERQQ
ncbi:MAG: HAMP domain-containing histidine kinase [Clostridiales bacterium]|nr:HAMP domain-containing histidine kinase [Clostridiales bacterium]